MLTHKTLIVKPLDLMMREQGIYATARHMRNHGASLEHALYVLKTVKPSSLI
jgi:hypothetical protein